MTAKNITKSKSDAFSPIPSVAMREAHQASAYSKWLKSEIQKAIDDPRPSVPHDDVMRAMRQKLASLSAAKKGE